MRLMQAITESDYIWCFRWYAIDADAGDFSSEYVLFGAILGTQVATGSRERYLETMAV